MRAEELGYDSVWVYDHVHNVPVPAHEAVFECWTTVAAHQPAHQPHPARARWSAARSYRNPALLAKITSTVDVISGGRLDWGIGAGWYEGEYRAYGYDFPSAGTRIAMLEDCVEIVKRMWTEADATYEGTHFSVAGAQCDPKPLQDPHPPIWIGGGGERKTLRVVATHATHSNFGGKPDEWAHKRDVLRGHCDGGRARPDGDHDDVVARGLHPRDRGRGRHRPRRSFWGEPFESWSAGNLVGTPEQVAEKIRTYVDLGCRGFVPWCSDYPDHETMELLATKVIPELR